MISREMIEKVNSGRYLLGVTGTMGSGKSYSCKKLVEIGKEIDLYINHVELDKIRIKVYSKNRKYLPIRRKLAEHFGSDILRPDTSIDRKLFGERLFKNEEDLKNEENQHVVKVITRDVFAKYIEKETKANGLFLIEWAMLGWQGFSDEVDNNFLIVKCNYDKQVSRLMKDSDLPVEQVEERIKAQGPIRHERNVIRFYHAFFHKGDLYEFDTSRNPGKKAHLNLLEKIVEGIK